MLIDEIGSMEIVFEVGLSRVVHPFVGIAAVRTSAVGSVDFEADAIEAGSFSTSVAVLH